ncbi:uncharacterized protein EI90DRAFT_1394130 [Cantharellus anzutake]|uniref:uncharacterized protein n=1 Tax=Cantharellus anzutake TaxID=1750568 RepID=UPI001907AEDC|nr:uncharacterized protein EI90DRAFT_1394130 [Cantharellus anzutake]KAF8329423.1 hypothetical protein EI90DRAFT_1394130 [Cantharellus anzutake]
MSDSSDPSPPETPELMTPPNLHQNSADPSAAWLVQKYGGTSVGKFASKICEEIVPMYMDQHRVAIVCSARSGSTKALGTTNLLLRAAGEALKRCPPSSGAVQGTITPFVGRPIRSMSSAAGPSTRSVSIAASSDSSHSSPPSLVPSTPLDQVNDVVASEASDPSPRSVPLSTFYKMST